MSDQPFEPAAAVPEMFCDAAGHVVLVRGMVRLELLVSGSRRGRVEEPPELGGRLVMSAQGFLRAFEAIDRAVTQSGLAMPPALAAKPGAGPPFRMARSPNFPSARDS
jgi:hypothetical protein